MAVSVILFNAFEKTINEKSNRVFASAIWKFNLLHFLLLFNFFLIYHACMYSHFVYKVKS